MTEREWNTVGADVNWAGITQDVVAKIEIIRLAWAASEAGPPEVHKLLVRDLYGPAMECIGAFCCAVEVHQEQRRLDA